ncbi:MAG: hypothetical protein A2X01_12640, partial [Bacteroidetes bacterium GWF2_35_48]
MKTLYITIALALLTLNLANSQNMPSLAPLNPDYVNYLNNLQSENVQSTLLPSPVVPDFNSFFAQPKTAKTFDAVYDLRTLNRMTPVKDQGACGSCYCFATIGSIESHWKTLGLGEFNLSEDNINNCNLYDLGPCNTGNHWVTTAYLARKAGPVTEVDDPYMPSGNSCPSGLHEAAYVSGAKFLPNDASAIKQAIVDYGALYTVLYIDDAYLNTSDNTYYYNGTNGINHAILVAGWDDTKVTAGGTGAWICKNSAGTGWGDNGYFYVSYNDTKIHSSVAMFPARIDYHPNSQLYQYDQFGWLGSYGYIDGNDFSLVKFTAAEADLITNVGTWVIAANATISAEIYDSFDGTNLTGLLGTVTAQSCDFPGYYTFDLATPFNIAAGNDFYVKINYSIIGCSYPIPVEYPTPGATGATVETGVGWISSTGIDGSWSAVGTGTSSVVDLCVKAYGVKVTNDYCYKIPALTGNLTTTGLPVANTMAATSVTTSSVVLNGIVNASGDPSVVTFEYGLTDTYGSNATADQSPVTGVSLTNVSADISGFNSGTLYHFRVKAVNSAGTVYGSDLTFTTTTAGTAPVAAFAANQTSITEGGAVNFTDNSTNTPTSWLWTFEGGTPSTSTDQNPTGIVYSTPGTFDVTLVATNAFGDDTEIKLDYITVTASGTAPVAAFVANQTTITEGGAVNFTDNSTNTPTSWLWTFEGGTPSTSTDQNPTGIVYSASGTYDVTLVATNAFGDDTEIKLDYITVTASGTAPVAAFAANQTSITEGGAVNFTDNSTNTPTSWLWTFEGGTPSTSTDQNPTGIVYSASGTYDVTLVATNAFGDDTEIKLDYITVTASGTAPVAAFAANQTSITEGGAVNFTDNSTNTPTSWLWTFEGGTPFTSTDQNPTGIVYSSLGTFDVTLVATNAFGDDTEIKLDYITVTASGTAPVAAFVANQTTLLSGGTVDFTDYSINTPTSWLWTFEGGTPSTSSQQNPAVVYSSSGTFNVTLIAINAFGDDTLIRTDYITVNPSGTAPFANFTASQIVITAGNSIDFTDNSANIPTSWEWTFDGGTPSISSDQNPAGIVFNTPGTYTIVLTASNAFGSNTKTKTAYITVNPAGSAPVANFTADVTTITAGGSINFTDNSTNTPTTWTWTFNGGTPSSSSDQNPSGIVFSSPGTYTIVLTATNAFGSNTKTKTAYVIVNPAGYPPVANFTANVTSIPAGGSVDFTDNSTNTPTSWDWTFNGGTPSTSSDQSPNGIVFNTPGTYTIVLTATNAFGSNTKTRTEYITVTPAGSAPIANFTANNTVITAGGSVNFTDNSSNTPTGWAWTFSGGTPSTSDVQNPTGIVFSAAGTYDVTLVATNAYGSNTKIKTDYIIVNPAGTAPVAGFTANQTSIYEGGTIQFYDTSLYYPTSWVWTFNGGTPATSNVQDPSVVYNTAGTYDVTLVAVNSFGDNTLVQTGYITVTSSSTLVNDDCSGAIVLTQSENCIPVNGTTVGATQSLPAIECNGFTGDADDDVWYQFVAITATPTITVVSSTGVDAVVELISGPCVGSNIDCADYSGDAGTETITGSGLTPGNTYYVRVYDYYTSPGTFTICVSDNAGNPPIADFAADATVIEEGETVNFTDYSTNTPTSWLWTFEGGTPSTSSDQNPSVVYNSAGIYSVTLEATNADGSGTLTLTNYITVNFPASLPYADFTADLTYIAEGETVTFTDYSSGSPTTWLWTFEGGTPSTSDQQNPAVVYNTTGIYDVSLTVTNASGSDAVTYSGYITVTSSGVAPVADFSSDYIYINAGNTVNYFDYSYNNPDTWLWYFPGGTPSSSADQNPANIVYNTPGSYDVTLIVSNASGADTITYPEYLTVASTGTLPYADFTSDEVYVSEGSTVQFTDLSSGSPDTWVWTFEGGTPSTSSDQNPGVVYSDAGTFSVSLTVSNADGSDSVSYMDYITVYSSGGTLFADFSADQTFIEEGQTVQFSDLSSGNPTAWSWIFDGGTPSSSTAQNPAVVYSTSGTYSVTLIVTDGTDTDTITYTDYIYVYPAGYPPFADFTSDVTTVDEGGTVNFYDLSTESPTSWLWTFEGGTPSTSSDQNPIVIYNTAGTYNVTLTATNSYGSDTWTYSDYITVNVTGSAPLADFTADATTVTEGGTVNFTDNSTNTPTSWSWTFEGGTPSTSTDQNPTGIVYSASGTFDVTLVATNAFGDDTEIKLNYITVTAAGTAPVAAFVANQTSITEGGTVNFTDNSTN